MAAYTARIQRVVTNGPFVMIVVRNGVGIKATISLATLALAMDAAKADLVSAIGAEVVSAVAVSVTTNGT